MLNDLFDRYIFTGQIRYKEGNFFLSNIPFAIITTELFTELILLNDEELNRKIYYAIKKSVRERIVNSFNVKPMLKEQRLIEFCREFFSKSGFGAIRFLEIDKKKQRAIALVGNSPIAKSVKARHPYPADHILRGVIAGILSNAFNADLECVETKCMAEGTSECEFIIKRNEEFDFTKEITQKQLEPKL